MNVTAALAVGASERTAAPLIARQFIEWGVELAGVELLARLYVLPAFPPIRVLMARLGLGLGFGLAEVGFLLVTFLGYALFFFTGPFSSLG